MRRNITLGFVIGLLLTACGAAHSVIPVDFLEETHTPQAAVQTLPPSAPSPSEPTTRPTAPPARWDKKEPAEPLHGATTTLVPYVLPSGVRGVAVHGDLVMAVGSRIWTSANVKRWESVESLGDRFSPNLQDIAVGETGIVVAGLTGEIIFSEDGSTWERAPLQPTETASRVVAAGPGFVAAGTRIWTSVDGREWTPASDELPEGVTELVTNGDDIVLFVGEDVWTSSDGEDWIQHAGAVPSAAGSDCTGQRPIEVHSLHGNSDGYIVTEGVPVLTGGPAAVWTSGDGLSWSRRELPNAGDTEAGILALAHGEGRYIALGITWHYSEEPPANGFPVGSCPSLLDANPVAWVSSDGTNWTILDDAEPLPFSYVEAVQAAVVPGRDRFLAWVVGDDVLVSIDRHTTLRLWELPGVATGEL